AIDAFRPSRVLLLRIALPSGCTDHRNRLSPRATAPPTQSESPIARGAWAAEPAPAARATFLQGLKFARLRSLNAFFSRNHFDSSFRFEGLHGIRPAIFFPMLRQTQQFSLWHLDQREHLAAIGDQHVVIRSRDSECAPESHALKPIQHRLYQQMI